MFIRSCKALIVNDKLYYKSQNVWRRKCKYNQERRGGGLISLPLLECNQKLILTNRVKVEKNDHHEKEKSYLE